MGESFKFYQTFYDAVKGLDNDTIAEFFKLLCEYALNGDVVDTENLVAKSLFSAFMPTINHNKKRKENGKKGGAPTGNNNAKKQPRNNQETTKKQPRNNQDLKEEKEERSKEEIEENNISEKEEKDINNIYIQKEEKDFDSFFADFKADLLGECNAYWREIMSMKYGIRNHSLALDEFKAHIIAQGKDRSVMSQTTNELKAYFSNNARLGFLSDKTKIEPKKTPKRKPCRFYTQRTGQGTIGVISQDGKTYYVSQDVGYPPTESHFWNPEHKRYEVQLS